MAREPRELVLLTAERLPDRAPSYVPLDPASTAQVERRQRRRPEEIAPRAIASYRTTAALPTSIDPGFLYRAEV